MPSDFDRPILNDGDREIIDEYASHEEIDDAETLAEYVRALARMFVAVSRDDSYHMGDIQRVVAVANHLERGKYTVDQVHEWLDDLSVPEGVSAPELEGDDAE